jgi:uncharacterized membrane protein YeaQ/YmgE (transglycosylase-associated protein family)
MNHRAAGYVADLRRVDQRRREHRMGIVGILAAGLVVGVLAKLLAPGARDALRLALAMAIGIAHLLVTLVLLHTWGGLGLLDADWLRRTAAVLGAALLVVLASSSTSPMPTSGTDEGH